MLTGLFFLGGLAAFTYLCWWIYDNERDADPDADGALPRRGLLAMATLDDLAEDAKLRKMPAWKRQKLAASQPTPESATPARKAGWSRTPGQRRKRR